MTDYKIIQEGQLTLFNEPTIEQKRDLEREKYRIEFLKNELDRLKEIFRIISIGEGKINIERAEIIFEKGNPINITLKDGLWERKKFLGEWWYCNHIKGWNNNVPIRDNSTNKSLIYDDVPDNELMAQSIRSCFVGVDRDEIRWDRDYCLIRLEKAIKSYEDLL